MYQGLLVKRPLQNTAFARIRLGILQKIELCINRYTRILHHKSDPLLLLKIY